MSEVEEDWDPNLFSTLQFSVVGEVLSQESDLSFTCILFLTLLGMKNGKSGRKFGLFDFSETNYWHLVVMAKFAKHPAVRIILGKNVLITRFVDS